MEPSGRGPGNAVLVVRIRPGPTRARTLRLLCSIEAIQATPMGRERQAAQRMDASCILLSCSSAPVMVTVR